MADSRNFIKTFDGAVQEQVEDFAQSLVVGRQVNGDSLFFAVGKFDADQGAVDADALGQAFGNYFILIALNIEQLIFERRRTGVEYKNFHGRILIVFEFVKQ